jgi:ankyrin repeat protein
LFVGWLSSSFFPQFLDFEKLMDHCQSGNVYDVEGFISSFGSEAVVMATDENNWTGLHYAAYLGDAGVVRLLLQHGADPNAKGECHGQADHVKK